MSVTHVDHNASLPRSHCFISLAHGSSIRTVRVRTGVLRSAVLLVALLGLWLVGSTLYCVFHDDLMASLMAREARMQYAYEDRIAALRGQVEHEASLKLVGQSTLEGQVRDLAQRAAALEMRASLVSELDAKLGSGKTADRTAVRHIPALTTAEDIATHADGVDNPAGDLAAEPAAAGRAGGPSGLPGLDAAGAHKPHPEADLGQPAGAAQTAQQQEAQPLRLRLAAVTEALEHVDAGQYGRIAAIGDHARRRLEIIRTALTSAGLSPARVEAKAEQPAVGGPYVPLDPKTSASPFGRALDAMQGDVSTAESLTRALPRLPFAKPMTGALEITSPYGARLDPFLGRPAMHTGVDLREEYGTDVRTTAAGRVVSAGPAGGYGIMVEVDHGHGLSTRYAHLSSISVEPGQIVTKGETVGLVGATGRATGPHLHYEVRIDGEPVDPVRFLLAGEKLAALDALP